jgi:hypothetical protein
MLILKQPPESAVTLTVAPSPVPQEIVIEFFHNGKIGITADKVAVAILRDNAKTREEK